MAKVIKEIIIMLLVCLATMLLLAIGLYKFIPSKKIVPEITKYVATEEVQDLLQDTIDEQDDDEILYTYDSGESASYEVTSSDLKNYQSTNDYVPGKANPFAVYSKTVTEDEVNGENSKETNQSTSENTSTSTEGRMPSVYSQNTGTK